MEEVFHLSRRGTKLLRDFYKIEARKAEAGNCMASGPMVLSLPDMCTSPIDTCREHEHEAAFRAFMSFPPPLTPGTFLSVAHWWQMPDDEDEWRGGGKKEGEHITGHLPPV